MQTRKTRIGNEIIEHQVEDAPAYTTDKNGNIVSFCMENDLSKIGTIGDGDGDRLYYFSEKTENQIGFVLDTIND